MFYEKRSKKLPLSNKLYKVITINLFVKKKTTIKSDRKTYNSLVHWKTIEFKRERKRYR